MSEIYERAIREELAYWPGVAVEFGKRSKHRQAVLHYRGETRFVVFPDSPSDAVRGHLNCLSNVRAELRALSATRLEKRPTKRKRKNRVIGNQMPHPPSWVGRIEKAPVKANPWEALAAYVPPPPAPPTLLQRAASGMVTVWRKLVRGSGRSLTSPVGEAETPQGSSPSPRSRKGPGRQQPSR